MISPTLALLTSLEAPCPSSRKDEKDDFFLLTTRVRKLHFGIKGIRKHFDKAHTANIRIERLENEPSRFARFVNIELFTIGQIEGPCARGWGKWLLQYPPLDL